MGATSRLRQNTDVIEEGMGGTAAAAAVLGRHLYVIGGNAPRRTVLTSVERYSFDDEILSPSVKSPSGHSGRPALAYTANTMLSWDRFARLVGRGVQPVGGARGCAAGAAEGVLVAAAATARAPASAPSTARGPPSPASSCTTRAPTAGAPGPRCRTRAPREAPRCCDSESAGQRAFYRARTTLASVELYDPRADRWRAGPALPHSRAEGARRAAVTARAPASAPSTARGPPSPASSCTTRAPTAGAPGPRCRTRAPREAPRCCDSESAGQRAFYRARTTLASVELYDPRADRWRAGPALL
ncbi:hypothetical protein MSG28_003457 [Choristoneura fumiferana]|uniref:Uncharacterized protein n=1 Tax=Choristoneura fumiferana TaxID=7141 RepID=A0ACC0KFC5_CHOFU|nr:hypothetical protein MSG28_003457 [Choristoneura fumiferana]